jgi:FtsH-binding integral membrane protein
MQPYSLPLWKEKRGFLLSVFICLIVQLAIISAVFQYMRKPENNKPPTNFKNIIYLVLAQILIIFAFHFLSAPKYMPIRVILLVVFSALLGTTMSFIKRVSSEEMNRAIIGTGSVFVSMFVIGLALSIAGVDVRWMGALLIVVLVGIIVTKIVFMFSPPTKDTRRWVYGITFIVFALFVMVDTNEILARDYAGDFTMATIDYVLDIVNIFQAIIGLDS